MNAEKSSKPAAKSPSKRQVRYILAGENDYVFKNIGRSFGNDQGADESNISYNLKTAEGTWPAAWDCESRSFRDIKKTVYSFLQNNQKVFLYREVSKGKFQRIQDARMVALMQMLEDARQAALAAIAKKD